MRLRVRIGLLVAGLCVAVGAAAPARAAAILRITEWMYNGVNGNEFIELTNVGDLPLDLTGYSFSDNTRQPILGQPGNVSLTPLGTLMPGVSALITERTGVSFLAAWNLGVNILILGANSQNLGRADEINLYDPTTQLVDRLTYNDALAGGGPRTLNVSGNLPLDALGLNQPGSALLSFVGDSYGSIASSDGDIGNPGHYAPVPEPAGVLLVSGAVAVLALLRRRRLMGALSGLLAAGLAGGAAAAPYYIGTGTIPGTASDDSGLTRMLEDGVTPENRIGGFGSAIAYTGSGSLYIATPDRGPADGATTYADRYYTIDVQVDPVAHTVTPTVTATHLLRNESGQQLIGSSAAFDPTNSPASRRFDPEGVRATADGHLWISDEYGPFVYEFDASGQRLQSFALPSRFLIDNPNANGSLELPPSNTSGRQSNRGMEGLAITPDGTHLFGAMQSPLIQDGALNPANGRVGVNVRFLDMNLTDDTTREHLYQLNAGSLGISEIVAVNANQFLVLERDGAAGASAAVKQLYLVSLGLASDVSGIANLPQGASPLPAGVIPVEKALFLNLLDPSFGLAGASFPEKIEGLAFGPDLPNGDHLLLVTSDNDFIAGNPSRIYAFGIPAADLPGYVPQSFAVPEPSALALLAFAAAAFVARRDRR